MVYGYIPAGMTLEAVRDWRKNRPQELMAASLASIKKHVEAMLTLQQRGAVVFDNGNLIRTQAKSAGVANAFDIPIFTEAFLRPLFCEAIGPYRWMVLSNDPQDIATIDAYLLERFPNNAALQRWIRLARENIPFEGLPARIAWLGHEDRTTLALAVNDMVADGTPQAAERLRLAITNDTALGVMRYADAGYDIAQRKAASSQLHYFNIH